MHSAKARTTGCPAPPFPFDESTYYPLKGMKGRNTLVLNHATVIEALQYYFDVVLYRKDRSPKIIGISPDARDSTLNVTVSDEETK